MGGTNDLPPIGEQLALNVPIDYGALKLLSGDEKVRVLVDLLKKSLDHALHIPGIIEKIGQVIHESGILVTIPALNQARAVLSDMIMPSQAYNEYKETLIKAIDVKIDSMDTKNPTYVPPFKNKQV